LSLSTNYKILEVLVKHYSIAVSNWNLYCAENVPRFFLQSHTLALNDFIVEVDQHQKASTLQCVTRPPRWQKHPPTVRTINYCSSCSTTNAASICRYVPR